MTFELFWRFVLISALAFGGGQAALPLVERTAVAETGWITPQDFSTAMAFSFITPGPVLVLATFIGYRVDGLAGAAAATIGVFLLPWFLAAAVAWQLQRFSQHHWLRGFGRGAGAAVIGLLLVTASSNRSERVRTLAICWYRRSRVGPRRPDQATSLLHPLRRCRRWETRRRGAVRPTTAEPRCTAHGWQARSIPVSFARE